ncbi:Hypothetical predicted protein, partial [Paramuricea clavata]
YVLNKGHVLQIQYNTCMRNKSFGEHATNLCLQRSGRATQRQDCLQTGQEMPIYLYMRINLGTNIEFPLQAETARVGLAIQRIH